MSRLHLLQLADGSSSSVRLTLALRQMDADVVTVSELDQLRATCRKARFDAAVLDLDLPQSAIGGPGQVCAIGTIREDLPTLPLLACGSPGSAGRIAALLGTAIDDFVLRPLDTEEIPVRIARMMEAQGTRTGTILENGPLRFDLVSRRVEVAGRSIALTSRERGVLQILLRHKGEAIAKTCLAERLSTLEEEIAPQTVETYVHGLRKKLRNASHTIKTIRGVGYLLSPSDCGAET